MTSLKPYLIRAIYQWIVDNNLTPHLLVDAENERTTVPRDFVDDGKIILNIKPAAIQGLSMGNKIIEFNACFSGKAMHISAPISAILAIYARENGKGMTFDNDDMDLDDDTPTPPPNRPQLRVVK